MKKLLLFFVAALAVSSSYALKKDEVLVQLNDSTYEIQQQVLSYCRNIQQTIVVPPELRGPEKSSLVRELIIHPDSEIVVGTKAYRPEFSLFPFLREKQKTVLMTACYDGFEKNTLEIHLSGPIYSELLSAPAFHGGCILFGAFIFSVLPKIRRKAFGKEVRSFLFLAGGFCIIGLVLMRAPSFENRESLIALCTLVLWITLGYLPGILLGKFIMSKQTP